MTSSLQLAGLLVIAQGVVLSAAVPTGPQHPVAIIREPGDETVFVACERSGRVVEVDFERGELLRSFGPLGTVQDVDRLSPQHIVAAVSTPPGLVAINLSANAGAAFRTWPLSVRLTGVRVSGDGRSIAVVSRSARSVQLLNANELVEPDGTSIGRQRIVTLSFQPGCCLWLPDHQHLLVADAYGGRLALLDALSAKLEFESHIPAHNISGLALSPSGERVYLTHQAIHTGAQTTHEDVHWGGILTNVLRDVAVSNLLDAEHDVLAQNVRVHLGDIGRAAGDPAGVAVRGDGVTVVSFGGVNELAFDRGLGFEWQRVAVGVRPTAVALTRDGSRALVVNTLDDTLSVVRLEGAGRVERTIPLGPAQELTAVDRGERLFFDARLSLEGWMSCHSCHTNGHTNGQLVDNFTDGTEYTPKRVLSLRGVRDTAPYAWDGHIPTLADQVHHSVTSTMQGAPLSDAQRNDLLAYLKTLAVDDDGHAEADAALIAQGRSVFEQHECQRCHAPPTFTSPDSYDVGLSDERGLRRFNPPSLRGVHYGDSFLHDGRANRLEDVFQVERHQLTSPLDEDDLRALTAFLKSL